MSPKNDKKLVLIVDDEPMDIKNVREILESSGEFQTITATDYNDAVRVFEPRAAEVQLALIDVALPGKNGVELAKRLLSINPTLRVLFASGHVGASVIRFYGINAGDEHYLQKPLKRTEVLPKVRQALASTQPLQIILSAARAGSGDEPMSGSDD